MPDDWEKQLGALHDRDDDPDDDDLTNIEELVLGTDPLNADTDGDGMSDNDEYLAGEDPLEKGLHEVEEEPEAIPNRIAVEDPALIEGMADQIKWELKQRRQFRFPANLTDDDLLMCRFMKAPFHVHS